MNGKDLVKEITFRDMRLNIYLYIYPPYVQRFPITVC